MGVVIVLLGVGCVIYGHVVGSIMSVVSRVIRGSELRKR